MEKSNLRNGFEFEEIFVKVFFLFCELNPNAILSHRSQPAHTVLQVLS